MTAVLYYLFILSLCRKIRLTSQSSWCSHRSTNANLDFDKYLSYIAMKYLIMTVVLYIRLLIFNTLLLISLYLCFKYAKMMVNITCTQNNLWMIKLLYICHDEIVEVNEAGSTNSPHVYVPCNDFYLEILTS